MQVCCSLKGLLPTWQGACTVSSQQSGDMTGLQQVAAQPCREGPWGQLFVCLKKQIWGSWFIHAPMTLKDGEPERSLRTRQLYSHMPYTATTLLLHSKHSFMLPHSGRFDNQPAYNAGGLWSIANIQLAVTAVSWSIDQWCTHANCSSLDYFGVPCVTCRCLGVQMMVCPCNLQVS